MAKKEMEKIPKEKHAPKRRPEPIPEIKFVKCSRMDQKSILIFKGCNSSRVAMMQTKEKVSCLQTSTIKWPMNSCIGNFSTLEDYCHLQMAPVCRYFHAVMHDSNL